MTAYYSEEELKEIGFANVGSNVKIYKLAKFINPELICIGSNVQIDDFAFLCGPITIGNYVHISIGVTVYGGGELYIEDYVNISARTVIITGTEDVCGNKVVGSTIPKELRNPTRYKMTIEKYVNICANCTINPGVNCRIGSTLGSHSVALSNLDEWSVYAGCPARFIKGRERIVVVS